MNYKVLLLMCFVAITMFSCSQNINTNQLTGTWKVVDFRADLLDLNPLILNYAEEIALSSIYTYINDSSCNRIDFEGLVNGKWKLDVQNKSITMLWTNPEFATSNEQYQIKKLNNNKMTWLVDFQELGHLEMDLEKK